MAFDFNVDFNQAELDDELVGSESGRALQVQWFNGKNNASDPRYNKGIPSPIGLYFPLKDNEKLAKVAEALDDQDFEKLFNPTVKTQIPFEKRQVAIINVDHPKDGGGVETKPYLWFRKPATFFILAHGCPYYKQIPNDPEKQVGMAYGLWTRRYDKIKKQTTETSLEVLAVCKELTEAGFLDESGMPIPLHLKFNGHGSREFFNALNKHYEFIKWVRAQNIHAKALYWQYATSFVPSAEKVAHGVGEAYAVQSGHPETWTPDYAKSMYVGDLLNGVAPFLYSTTPDQHGKPILNSRESYAVLWCQQRTETSIANQAENWGKYNLNPVVGTNKEYPIEWLTDRTANVTGGGFGRPKVTPPQGAEEFDAFNLSDDEEPEEEITEETSTTEEIDPVIAGHLKSLHDGKAYYDSHNLVTNANKVDAMLERWAEKTLTPETLAAYANVVAKDLAKREAKATKVTAQ